MIPNSHSNAKANIRSSNHLLPLHRPPVTLWSLLVFRLGFGGSIDIAAIANFIDYGHDLIIGADANLSDLIREIATDIGVN